MECGGLPPLFGHKCRWPTVIYPPVQPEHRGDLSATQFAVRPHCHLDRSAAPFWGTQRRDLGNFPSNFSSLPLNSHTLQLLNSLTFNLQLLTLQPLLLSSLTPVLTVLPSSVTSVPPFLFFLSPPRKSALQFPRVPAPDIPCPVRLHRQRLSQPHGRIHRSPRGLRHHRTL